MDPWTIQHADALTALRTLPDASVDSVVTDPPAGITFMGKDWDKPNAFPLRTDRARLTGSGNPTVGHGFAKGMAEVDTSPKGRAAFIDGLTPIFAESLRVLKPGGHALVWALPRTSHWTATALEDAGFEIRDSLHHLFGSGFPKSHNLSGDWDGWGTALKPSHEVWWLCRKPLAAKTVAAQVLDTGTGALNIDACRTADTPYTQAQWTQKGASRTTGSTYGTHRPSDTPVPTGRWPSNLLLSHAPTCDLFTCTDECPVAELDRQSGVLKSGGANAQDRRVDTNIYGNGRGLAMPTDTAHHHGDSGGASRFFPTFRYQAKPSRRERGADNTHPTVKSVALMRWLCRLITPPGGLVADPFMGSGTTGVACAAEGFRFWGCDENAEYIQIATARVSAAYNNSEEAAS